MLLKAMEKNGIDQNRPMPQIIIYLVNVNLFRLPSRCDEEA